MIITTLSEGKGQLAAPSEYDVMCADRARMVRSFLVWLRSGPSARDVAEEIDATASVPRQFATLAAEGRNAG